MKIKRKTSRAEVPTMAMGDIAFNLLIFFVILARVTDDSHLKWQPAQAKETESGKQAKVSVLIDVDEKVYMNGQPIGIAQLSKAVEQQLGDAPTGERIVQLKIHRNSKALIFEPVIEAISEAGGDLFHVVDPKGGS
jgi:biopolymer transport protein ExbD